MKHNQRWWWCAGPSTWYSYLYDVRCGSARDSVKCVDLCRLYELIESCHTSMACFTRSDLDDGGHGGTTLRACFFLVFLLEVKRAASLNVSYCHRGVLRLLSQKTAEVHVGKHHACTQERAHRPSVHDDIRAEGPQAGGCGHRQIGQNQRGA